MQKDDKRGKEETCRNKFFSSPQNIGESPKKIIRNNQEEYIAHLSKKESRKINMRL